MKKTTILLLTLMMALNCQAQFGGLKKWFNKEVVPTIKGERPLNIDPGRVRISHNGKDILRASAEDKGSVYVDFGIGKLQTNDLYTRIGQAGAIYSGNTAVMTQVAFEQFQKFNEKQLKEAEKKKEVSVSLSPPQITPIREEPRTGREVVIFNHTLSQLNYAMNGNFFSLEPETGFTHTSTDGDFFLQFDEDVSEEAKIARYYLTGSAYGLYFYKGMDKIAIKKHN